MYSYYLIPNKISYLFYFEKLGGIFDRKIYLYTLAGSQLSEPKCSFSIVLVKSFIMDVLCEIKTCIFQWSFTTVIPLRDAFISTFR